MEDFERERNTEWSAAASAPGAILYRQDERDCLRRLDKLAQRRGHVLSLKLANGTTKTFETTSHRCFDYDSPSYSEENRPAECISYTLKGYFPAHRHVLLDVGEGQHYGWYSIVSGRTGHETRIPNIPHYAPGGRRFASVNPSEAEDHAENAIYIWSTGEPPKLEFHHQPKGYTLYRFDRWEGSDRVVLSVEFSGEEGLKRAPATVVRTKEGWRLDSPVPQ
jgi:hypothetical protein